MNDTEKKLSVIREGNIAEICLQNLGPIIDELYRNADARLKNVFRSGQYSESVLAAGVSALCTIDELRDMLKQKITRANNAHAQLNGEKNG